MPFQPGNKLGCKFQLGNKASSRERREANRQREAEARFREWGIRPRYQPYSDACKSDQSAPIPLDRFNDGEYVVAERSTPAPKASPQESEQESVVTPSQHFYLDTRVAIEQRTVSRDRSYDEKTDQQLRMIGIKRMNVTDLERELVVFSKQSLNGEYWLFPLYSERLRKAIADYRKEHEETAPQTA